MSDKRHGLLGVTGVLCAALYGNNSTCAASAQTVIADATHYTFDIPAGPLASSLIGISLRSHTRIAFSPELVAGYQAPRITGSMTEAEAIAHALHGTGLGAVQTAGHAITITRQPIPATSAASATPLVRTAAGQSSKKTSTHPENLMVVGHTRRTDPQRPPTSSFHVSGRYLEQQRINSLEDLQQVVPSLNVDAGDPFNTTISIRGVGDGGGQTGGEVNIGMPSSVGLFLDGVYLSRPGMMSHGFNDLDSIDVYNGATQGTLYSANVTGGVIDIHTREPTEKRRAEAFFSYGSYDYLRATAVVSGRIARNLYGSISYMHTGMGGIVKNLAYGNMVDGNYGNGVRTQLVWHPSSDVKLRLIADYSAERSTSTPVLYQSITAQGVNSYVAHSQATGNKLVYGRDTNIDRQNYDSVQQLGVSPQVTWNMRNGWKFSSISSFRYFTNDPSMSDPQSIDVYHDSGWAVRDRTWYQEFRFDSPHWKHIDLATGISYSGESMNTNAHSRYGSAAAAWYGSSSYNNLDVLRYGYLRDNFYGIFGQTTVRLLPVFDIKAGFRESVDDKQGSFVRENKNPFASGMMSQTTPLPSGMVNLNYHPDKDTLIYLALAYAKKAGAMNVSSGAATKAGYGSLILKPEASQTIELGLQREFTQSGISTKIDVFESLIHNFQTQGYDSVSQSTYLLNAGEYRARGFEASMTWAPVTGLSITPYFMYNGTRYLDYKGARCAPEVSLAANAPSSCNLTGRPVFRAPKYTFNVSGRYEKALSEKTTLYYTARYAYRSSTYATVDDSPSAKIPAYGLIDMSAGVRHHFGDHQLDASIWVNNLLDKTYYMSLREGDYGSVVGYLGSPRVIGGSVRVSF